VRPAPLFTAFLLVACAPKPAPVVAPPPAPEAPPAPPPRANPLLSASTLDLQYPRFDLVQDGDFREAFTAGMAEQLAEVQAIAKNPEAPTFENTLVALERSGATLTRVNHVFGALNGSNTDDELQKIEEEMAPKLAAHADAILLDSALFARVDAVYAQRATLKLDPESAQLLERYHANFVRAGARLSDADKATLKALNGEISTASTAFEQHTRDAMTDGGVVVDDVAQLAGLSEGEVSAAAEAAKARGLTGKWVITLQNTTIQPVLGGLKDRALREKIFRASSTRAQGGEGDNTAILTKLVDLRAKKAALLGYPDFASWALTDETAEKPENVDKMLAELGGAALAKAKGEAADLQKIIDAEAKAAKAKPFALQPWDWAFYAEKQRKAQFYYDEATVKPYFEMEHVLKDGVFYAATQLYGITFVERKDLPVYNPSVRTFEVHDADGSLVGLFLVDWFQRPNKQGGAWMENVVDQSTLLGTRPVIVNNLNIPPVPAGQPVLLTFDEVETAFHEFGHALHGLFANTKYPLLSGTATPPDFVEYPSQFNEMWATDPTVLAHYARHYQTGEPMPKALFDKVIAAKEFGGGYATLEYIEAAQLDMAWHEVPVGKAPAAAGVMEFEAAALTKFGTNFAPVPPRYHSPYFNHIFAGGGYEAGYYAYIWSEVLARDTGAWFMAHGGLTRENGDAFRKGILSRGRTEEPSVLFNAFYGKDPEVGPLLDYRGLPHPKGRKK
jgi:peptidyl-dipeptidase Dcp